jgi:thiamine biosynthesis lipoprotein
VAERLGVGVLVSLGGDIATAGPAPAAGWQVRVQDTDHDPATQVELAAGTALATSSTTRRTWRRGTDELHHIVDPRTGRPADPVWRTVSVVAASCRDANAAATATIVKGRRGLAWLGAQGLPARLVGRDGTVHLRNGWPAEPEGDAA